MINGRVRRKRGQCGQDEHRGDTWTVNTAQVRKHQGITERTFSLLLSKKPVEATRPPLTPVTAEGGGCYLTDGLHPPASPKRSTTGAAPGGGYTWSERRALPTLTQPRGSPTGPGPAPPRREQQRPLRPAGHGSPLPPRKAARTPLRRSGAFPEAAALSRRPPSALSAAARCRRRPASPAAPPALGQPAGLAQCAASGRRRQPAAETRSPARPVGARRSARPGWRKAPRSAAVAFGSRTAPRPRSAGEPRKGDGGWSSHVGAGNKVTSLGEVARPAALGAARGGGSAPGASGYRSWAEEERKEKGQEIRPRTRGAPALLVSWGRSLSACPGCGAGCRSRASACGVRGEGKLRWLGSRAGGAWRGRDCPRTRRRRGGLRGISAARGRPRGPIGGDSRGLPLLLGPGPNARPGGSGAARAVLAIPAALVTSLPAAPSPSEAAFFWQLRASQPPHRWHIRSYCSPPTPHTHAHPKSVGSVRGIRAFVPSAPPCCCMTGYVNAGWPWTSVNSSSSSPSSARYAMARGQREQSGASLPRKVGWVPGGARRCLWCSVNPLEVYPHSGSAAASTEVDLLPCWVLTSVLFVSFSAPISAARQSCVPLWAVFGTFIMVVTGIMGTVRETGLKCIIL